MSSSSYTSLPPVPDGFEWRQQAWGPVLSCGPLGAIAPHVFTTRQLELSNPEQVGSLARVVGARQVAMATQVHGRNVLVIREGSSVQDPRPQADVLVSDAASTAIAVRVADCVPLLVADRTRGVVAAVHAGWRGTAACAAVAAVEALGREFGSRPSDLVAAIGPSIGGCCYEVGPELVDAFAAAGHGRHLIDRWFLAPPPPRGSEAPSTLRLDLPAANRDQLVLAGVAEDQIYLSGLCTAMRLDVFTSYRKEKEKAGRMVGVICVRV